MSQESIVGISFSTRMIGVVTIAEYQIKQFQIKLFKDTWSEAKACDITNSLSSCIDKYNTTTIVLSIPALRHRSKRFDTIYQFIKKFAHEYKINFKEVPRNLLGKLCGKGERRNKKNQMLSLVRFFPELIPFYQKEITNKNKYYEKGFEAVGSILISISKN
jgi:RNase H-fold protein (predicted Holliday junction resolvase)